MDADNEDDAESRGAGLLSEGKTSGGTSSSASPSASTVSALSSDDDNEDCICCFAPVRVPTVLRLSSSFGDLAETMDA